MRYYEYFNRDEEINQLIDDEGNTLLHAAVTDRSVERVEELMRSGINPFIKNASLRALEIVNEALEEAYHPVLDDIQGELEYYEAEFKERVYSAALDAIRNTQDIQSINKEITFICDTFKYENTAVGRMIKSFIINHKVEWLSAFAERGFNFMQRYSNYDPGISFATDDFLVTLHQVSPDHREKCMEAMTVPFNAVKRLTELGEAPYRKKPMLTYQKIKMKWDKQKMLIQRMLAFGGGVELITKLEKRLETHIAMQKIEIQNLIKQRKVTVFGAPFFKYQNNSLFDVNVIKEMASFTDVKDYPAIDFVTMRP